MIKTNALVIANIIDALFPVYARLTEPFIANYSLQGILYPGECYKWEQDGDWFPLTNYTIEYCVLDYGDISRNVYFNYYEEKFLQKHKLKTRSELKNVPITKSWPSPSREHSGIVLNKKMIWKIKKNKITDIILPSGHKIIDTTK